MTTLLDYHVGMGGVAIINLTIQSTIPAGSCAVCAKIDKESRWPPLIAVSVELGEEAHLKLIETCLL